MKKLLLLSLFICLISGSLLAQGTLPTNGLVGKWDFENAGNLGLATVGQNLNLQALTGITTLVLGGTSVLIMVSVVIETMRQIDSQIVMHTYERY